MIDYRDSVPKTADIVVIGGGIVGAATAFHLAKAGLRPLVVERRRRLASLTTAAATGAFRLQLGDAVDLPLVRRSVRLFEEFEAETGQSQYRARLERRGYLWITTLPDSLPRQRSIVEAQRSWGVDGIELLSGDESRYRFPYLPGNVLQARYRAADGFLDPKAIAHGLILGSKVSVVVGTEVVGLDVQRGRLVGVETDRGSISTNDAVVAAGPFSAKVASLAGIRLPVELIRRQRLYLPEVPSMPRNAPMTLDDDTLAHWRPALGGAFVLYPEPDARPEEAKDRVETDPSFAFRVLDPDSPVTIATTGKFWSDVWRHGAAHWSIQAGQYTMTPDHRPLLGPTSVQGVWINSGYSGHGVMSGPGGSELVVEEIIGVGTVPASFRLDRTFECRPAATFS